MITLATVIGNFSQCVLHFFVGNYNLGVITLQLLKRMSCALAKLCELIMRERSVHSCSPQGPWSIRNSETIQLKQMSAQWAIPFDVLLTTSYELACDRTRTAQLEL